MTEAMPFLQKAILLSYAPRPFSRELPLLPFEGLVYKVN